MFDIFIINFKKYIPFLVIIASLFIFDTVTGLSKAFYQKNYMSSKARKCFSKLLVYISLIGGCMMMECLLELCDYHFKFVKLVIIAMSLVEFTSIAENFEEITGKNFITNILDFIIENIKSFIKKFTESEEKTNGE